MRPRPRPALVLAFVLAMTAVFYINDPPNPRPGRALKEAAEQLRQHYRDYPIREDWEIFRILTQRDAVWVDVRVPEARASWSTGNVRDTLAKRIGDACPTKSSVVWQIIAASQDIEVRAVAPDGRVAVAVSCRTATR